MKRAAISDLVPALVDLDRIAILDRGDRGDGAAVHHIGAAGARIEQDGEREPRIVGLGVMIVQYRGEAVLAQMREMGDLAARQPSARSEPVAERQEIVEGKPGMNEPRLPLLPAIDRQEEALRDHEMGRRLEQACPLEERFPHKSKLEMLEIAQAPMNQLR